MTVGGNSCFELIEAIEFLIHYFPYRSDFEDVRCFLTEGYQALGNRDGDLESKVIKLHASSNLYFWCQAIYLVATGELFVVDISS